VIHGTGIVLFLAADWRGQEQARRNDGRYGTPKVQ
jgi:hypothetical protein